MRAFCQRHLTWSVNLSKIIYTMTQKKKCLTTVIIVFIVLLTKIIISGVDRWQTFEAWRLEAENSMAALAWPGFNLQKGLYNFTVVTALIDIGRGEWTNQKRSYSTYLALMQRVLRLDVNMVIFIDQKGAKFLELMRRGRENRTLIEKTNLSDLPYYKYKDRMSEIMKSAEYKEDNQLSQKGLCEATIPEYDIVQLSKMFFLDRAVRRNPFNNSYFIWLDAGYGHGKDIFPPDGVWRPRNLFQSDHKLTIIERSPGVSAYADVQHKLHKLSINILAGNFMAGGGQVWSHLYQMQQEEVDRWMGRGVIDDDQTMLLVLYYRNSSWFNLVPGDWDDVFRLFN